MDRSQSKPSMLAWPRCGARALCALVVVFAWACGEGPRDAGPMPAPAEGRPSRDETMFPVADPPSSESAAASIDTAAPPNPAGRSGRAPARRSAPASEPMSAPTASAADSGAPPRLNEAYYGEAWSPASIPAECQGFALEGLRYSPGGALLPNRCEPFHPTTNNPYAVRCIDAWASYQSGFAGDSSCILPPPPELGMQIGAHPQSTHWFEQVAAGDLSGYGQASDDWVMQPGEEETLSYRTSSSNTEAHDYYRVYYRARPGSHHTGISAHDDSSSEREVWLPLSTLPSQVDPLHGPLLASIGAFQRPDVNNPVTLDKPEEDAGLYELFPAGAAIVVNMHHFNFQQTPLLKEIWVNVFWESDARYKVDELAAIPVDQALTLALPAGTTTDLHYFWTITEPVRLLELFAHRHAWTPNVSAWLERAAGGEPELIYQSLDWFDVPTYRYDSLTQNPAPSPMMRSDGASSGILTLQKGDELHFNCHITFTDERAAAMMLPKTATEIGTLRFANEAYDAEMCSLLGETTQGPKLPQSPTVGSGPLPAFAVLQ